MIERAITILPETTKNPITLIGKRAGICYGSDISDDEKNYKRGLDCINSGHWRAMEFVNVELIIEGYSARVIREWYTHIGGMPTRLQSSTRYIDYSKRGFDYVVPQSIQHNATALTKWQKLMQHIQHECFELETDYNISKEDYAKGLRETGAPIERSITWCDLLYITACECAKDKMILITRYPISKIVASLQKCSVEKSL